MQVNIGREHCQGRPAGSGTPQRREPFAPVERRWARVYSQVTDDPLYYRAEL